MNGCHLGILSFRAGELIPFYRDKLGFREVESRMLTPDLMETIFSLPAACRMTKLLHENLTLEIFSPIDLTPPPLPSSYKLGLNHFALWTGDKQQFCRRLEEQGVDVIKCAYKDRFVYFVRDPDGNLIEIFD